MARVARIAVAVTLLSLVACTTALPSTRPSASIESAASPSGSAPWSCTNPEGGQCLGVLAAGTYTTVVFEPAATYTVPDDWQNWEDTPGNFLLVAPGYSLEGVNAHDSDFIGIYTSVMAEDRGCEGAEDPGVAHTPVAMAAEFAVRPGLVTSEPIPAVVGGLTGLVMDLTMAADWTGSCFQDPTPVVQLIGGVPPSGLDHVMVKGLTMRLYLLAYAGGTLAIEVDDLAEGTHLDGYSQLVDQVQFGT